MKREFKNCLASALLLALAPLLLFSQTNLNSLSSVVYVKAPEKLTLKRNKAGAVDFTVQIKNGFHVNSNTPADQYLIPLRWTFEPGMVEVADVTYPKPKLEKFSFSEKPVSVFDGEFVTSAKLKAVVKPGQGVLKGKLRYQACNDRMCLPPRTLEINVPVEVTN